MPTWLRTALQYAPLVERTGRGLARFVRRLRGREAPSLEDAREANERAQAAIERERFQSEDTPAETPRSKRGDGA